jgi:hypothetical protein
MAHTNITISNSGFSPESVTIQKGDAIEWVNSSDQVQDATGDTFTTGPIQPGSTSLPISFDFADPGLHYQSTTSGFHGTVIVQAIQSGQVVHWPQVRALFTDEDVDHMLDFGLNLASKDEVCQRADEILDRVTRNGPGRMPPPPRDKWSDDKVNLLRTWKAAGCPD